MFALSVVCTSDSVSLATITVGFGTLSVLASAQDIAVDSWGLQLPATYVVSSSGFIDYFVDFSSSCILVLVLLFISYIR